MKMKSKRALFFVLIIMIGFLVTSLPAVASQADEGAEEPFDVVFTYGINGVANWNRKMPVTAEITNMGSDFEGRAVLMSYYGDDYYYSYYYDTVAYVADVMIPAGESREVNFTLPSLAGNDWVILYIEDTKGNTVFAKEYPVSLWGSTRIYAGVLSDEPESQRFLEQKDFTLKPDGKTSGIKMIPLTEGDLSRNLSALDMLNLLIITDFDTSSLSDRQYEELKQWVDKGGILLIGTGPAYNKTLSGFDDEYITGTIGSLAKKENTFFFREHILQDHIEVTEAALTYDALDIQMDGSREFPEWSFQMLEKGNGKVLIFDFDLSGWEFRSWIHNFDYVQEVLNTFLTEQEWYAFFEDDSQAYVSSWRLRYSISNTFFDSLPAVGLYLNVLLLYVVLMLLLYLLLKKLDKRHLMWLSIPVLSIFFGLIIFILGSGTRQRDVFMNYAAVMKLKGDSAAEKVYFSTTSPKNKDYSFDVDGSYYVHPAENYNYYSSQLSGSDKKYEIGLNKTPAKTTLEVRNVSSFQTKYYIGTRTAKADGGIDIQAVYGEDGLTGTITNQTGNNLTDCGLILYRSVLYFGDLANGQTVRIEDCLESSGNGYYSYNISEFLLKESEDMTIAETGLRSSKRNLLSEELDTFLSGNWINQSLFIGFTLDYEPAICNTIGYDVNGYTMYMAEAEVEYRHNGKVSIPNINGYMNVFNYVDYYYSEDGLLFYGEELEAYCDFGIDMEVGEIDIRYEYMASNLDIYFYDFEAADYVKVFDGNTVQSISDKLEGDLSNYFDSNGQLYIKAVNLDYSPDRYYYESYMPTISITGRVK